MGCGSECLRAFVDFYFPGKQRFYSARYFRVHIHRAIDILREKTELLQEKARHYLSEPEDDGEDGSERALFKAASLLLAACVSAHLQLIRVAVFYPWRRPYYTNSRYVLVEETKALGHSIMQTWELLRVWGVARKRLLARFALAVGEHTLQAREIVYAVAGVSLTGSPQAVTSKQRHSVALRETRGEREGAEPTPSRGGAS